MSRKVGLIVLVLVLTLGTATAAHAHPMDREPAGGGFLKAMSRLLGWAGWVVDGSILIFIKGWEGSHLDPNGNPIP